MGFSEAIKTEALIKCGRCCCLCQKYCGNNIEVHHIKAVVEGGEDSFDNAIPLCFDCHAEVRQYDPKHPKGIKFSEKELKRHRDNWYERHQNRGSESAEKQAPIFEPIKIYRQQGYRNLKYLRVESGNELLSYASGVFAMTYIVDEPELLEESELIANLLQRLNDYIDFSDNYQPGGRITLAFEFKQMLKDLDEMGFWVFVAKEIRRSTGGVGGSSDFPTLNIQILRKTNAEIEFEQGIKE